MRQPWPWAILHAGKRIENRTWAPPVEMIGQRFLLHAAKGCTGDYGCVLRDVRDLPFTPLRGALGFFEVPDDVVAKLGVAA